MLHLAPTKRYAVIAVSDATVPRIPLAAATTEQALQLLKKHGYFVATDLGAARRDLARDWTPFWRGCGNATQYLVAKDILTLYRAPLLRSIFGASRAAFVYVLRHPLAHCVVAEKAGPSFHAGRCPTDWGADEWARERVRAWHDAHDHCFRDARRSERAAAFQLERLLAGLLDRLEREFARGRQLVTHLDDAVAELQRTKALVRRHLAVVRVEGLRVIARRARPAAAAAPLLNLLCRNIFAVAGRRPASCPSFCCLSRGA